MGDSGASKCGDAGVLGGEVLDGREVDSRDGEDGVAATACSWATGSGTGGGRGGPPPSRHMLAEVGVVEKTAGDADHSLGGGEVGSD